MAELLETLQAELDEDTIRELSERIGSDEETTQRATSMLLPVLIAGLSRNVDRPEGRRELDHALERDHDGSLLDQLGGMLRGEGGLGDMLGGLFGSREETTTSTTSTAPRASGQAPADKRLDGDGILRHLLGSERASIEEGVARASGMDRSKVASLMTLLAPIVMSALGRVKRKEHLGADGIAEVIRRERRVIEEQAPETQRQGGLSRWLDSNRDGKIDFSDDIAKVGMAIGSALLIGRGRRRAGR